MMITRWRRYGHDRLYLASDRGDVLGWYDLSEGKAHPAKGVCPDLMIAEVGRWMERHAPQQPRPISGDGRKGGVEACEEVFHTGPGFTATETGACASPPVIEGIMEGWQRQEVPTWPPPTGLPVTDLAYNAAGANLQPQVDAARAAGERPTLSRSFFLGHRAYSSWEKGQHGEQLVARELQGLARRDPRWGFINSIPVGAHGADIDHVVVGPGGVFTLNAKCHFDANIWVGGNTLLVNGTFHPYIRNARHEAQRASRLLTEVCRFAVEVHGIVVLVDCRNLTVREAPSDITVVRASRVVRYLCGRTPVLTPDRVVAIYHAARLSNTWQTSERGNIRQPAR